MSYKIVQIEVTKPLSNITLADDNTGLALVVRRKERPIGFIMREFPPQSVISAEEIARWITKKIGSKLLQDSIREELVIPLATEQFPSLTVAICTKDRPENLARCLNSLLKLRSLSTSSGAKTQNARGLVRHEGQRLNHSQGCLSAVTDSQFEVLVVDNAPSDNRTLELVATLDNVNYVCEPKAGLDFARNRAIIEAKGELLAYLDDDVTVDRQWLDGIKEAWAENPDAAAFTGLVLPYELETEAQILFEKRGGFRRGFKKIRYGQILPGDPFYPGSVSGTCGVGCNMAFKREVLIKLGGFDEALDTGAPLPGGGDLDIFYRVIRGGYVLVYEPRYLIYHQHRRELAKLRHQYWTWGLGLMTFLAKSYQYDPSQRLKLLRLINCCFRDFFQQLIKSFFGLHSLPPGMILSQIWDGIIGLLGEYSRSQKRIEQIERQFPDSTVTFPFDLSSTNSN